MLCLMHRRIFLPLENISNILILKTSHGGCADYYHIWNHYADTSFFQMLWVNQVDKGNLKIRFTFFFFFSCVLCISLAAKLGTEITCLRFYINFFPVFVSSIKYKIMTGELASHGWDRYILLGIELCGWPGLESDGEWSCIHLLGWSLVGFPRAQYLAQTCLIS